MSAAVVSDNAIAVIDEEHHLRVPIIGRERPAVAKNDGLTFAPVLVINFDSVFCGDCRHRLSPWGICSDSLPCAHGSVRLIRTDDNEIGDGLGSAKSAASDECDGSGCRVGAARKES